MQQRARHAESVGVSCCGSLLNGGASGVGQSEDSGGLVEGFSGSVIGCTSDQAAVRSAAAVVEVSVTAADDKTDTGIDGCVVSHAAGVDVSFDVIDGDEWDVECECDCFGGGESDEEGADQSGFRGDSDRCQLIGGAVGLLKSGRDDGQDSAHVGA